MLLFRIMLAIASAVALLVLYFFAWGLSDGTVSSRNILMWLALLGGVAAVLVGGWTLNAAGQRAPPAACSRSSRCRGYCRPCSCSPF